MPDGSRQAYYRLFRTPDQGLMNTDYTRIDRYSAAALNLIAGWRSWRGNKNPSPNVPAELVRPPRENRLTVRDAATGVPLAGAEVRVFQGDPDHYLRPGVEDPYGKHVDAVADLTLTADAAGRVLLGENPFDRAMRLTGSNAVAVVRVAQEGRVGYGYLEWRAFVLAYWRGERELADHELRVDMRRQAAGDAVSRPRP